MTAAPDPRTGTARQSPLVAAMQIAILLKLVLIIVLAYRTHFVMDEFWHFGMAKYLGNQMFETIWPTKAVGYAMFYSAAHAVGWDGVSMLLAARLQTAALALALCAIVYLSARALGEPRGRALFAVLVLVCISTFVERGFRVRSEPLAVTFAALALLAVLRPRGLEVRGLVLAGVLSGLAFLSTQKSVYFNVALGLALAGDALWHRSLWLAVKRGVLLIFGWTLPLVVYCIGFGLGGGGVFEVAVNLFTGPLELATDGGSYYQGLRAFIMQTLMRNLPFYALCFVGLLIASFGPGPRTPGQRVAMIFTWVMAVLIFGHNQPWPYIFVMVLPFLALWAGRCLALVEGRTVLRGIALAVLAFCVAGSFARNWRHLEHDNRHQLELVAHAESLLGLDQGYFDGNGMIPNRWDRPRIWLDANTVRQTLLPDAAASLTRRFTETPPAVVLRSYRSAAIAEVLDPLLERSYVDIAANIAVPGRRIEPGTGVEFDVPLAGSYALYAADGARVNASLMIDGKSRSLPVDLAQSRVKVRIEGAQTLYLLPHDLPRPPVPEATPKAVFTTPYTF